MFQRMRYAFGRHGTFLGVLRSRLRTGTRQVKGVRDQCRVVMT